MSKVEQYITSIPDFPKEGIIFRDITTVLGDADGFHLAVDEMTALLDGVEFDAIAGLESRGFLFGAPMAYNLRIRHSFRSASRESCRVQRPACPTSWSTAWRPSRYTAMTSSRG